MSCEDAIEWVQGNLRDWICQYADDNENPHPCVGLSFVLHIKFPSGTISRTAEIIDANAGTFKFTWQPGDWESVGTFDADLEEISIFDGKGITTPKSYTITVRARL